MSSTERTPASPAGPASWSSGGPVIGFALGIAAGAAGLLVWLATGSFGVGTTPDSVAYLSAAESLLEGRGLRLFDGSPYADWPPAYPWLVATIARLGLDVFEAARVVEVGAAAGIVVAAALLAARLGASPAATSIAALATIVVPPFLAIAPMAWSEPLFVLLVLAFFAALLRDGERPTPSTAALVTVLAAAAILTRYLGVVLLPIGIVVLARHGIGRAGAFAVAAATPLGLWAARNVATLGAPFGRRRPGGTPILESLERLDANVAGWVLPAVEPGAVVGIGLTALVVVSFTAVRRTGRALPLAAFALLYPATLVLLASRAPLDALDARLLFPLAIPLVVLAGVAGSRLAASPLIALVALVWALPAASEAAATVASRIEHGAGGYATAVWREGSVAERLAAVERGERLPIYTNAPDALWAIAGRRASFTPWRASTRSSAKPVPGRHWPAGRFRVVWFDRVERGYLRPIEELETLFDWEVEDAFEGGRIACAEIRREHAQARTRTRASGVEGRAECMASVARGRRARV